MKQHKIVIFSGLFCIVMAILLMYLVGGFTMTRPEYNGSRELSATELRLDFTEMNSSFSHTMTLAKDDQLHCSWNIEQGTVDLLVVSESGEKIYQGNKVDHADFKLVVPSDGDYTFTITGSKAKGVIHFQKIDLDFRSDSNTGYTD